MKREYLDQSDYRISEIAVSQEWVEVGNQFFLMWVTNKLGLA